MEFRTTVKIDKADYEIPPFERILCVGSCFADNIGRKFDEEKFHVTANPFGVMYNPASIFHTVSSCDCAPRVAVLTLGTNHVYILKETGEIVDNCRKQPQHLFREKRLSVGDCVDFLSQAIEILVDRQVDVRIIITVSPIRYAKYGFHGSQLSKSTLLLATNVLTEKYPGRVAYFPAYEIVNDELRDYRFYKADMLHPSDQAVEYIWQRFCDTFLGKDALKFMAEWRPIKEAFRHKPFNPASTDYEVFMWQTGRKVEALRQKYPELEI